MRGRMKKRINKLDKTKRSFSSLENLRKYMRFANSLKPSFLSLALTVSDASGLSNLQAAAEAEVFACLRIWLRSLI